MSEIGKRFVLYDIFIVFLRQKSKRIGMLFDSLILKHFNLGEFFSFFILYREEIGIESTPFIWKFYLYRGVVFAFF